MIFENTAQPGDVKFVPFSQMSKQARAMLAAM
jgi:hypothetical protein